MTESELDDWVESHFDEESEEYVFASEELSFCVRAFGDVPAAIITPTKYFEDSGGYCFDQSITIPGLDWDEICEGTFTPEGDDPVQFLKDLGMTENLSLGEYAG